MKRQKWQHFELELIENAVKRIQDGASIYSQVMILWNGGELRHRTWESIRSKIGRELKRRRG